MITIEKEFSYGILAIVGIVAIVILVTIIKPPSYLQVPSTEEDLVGEAFKNINRQIPPTRQQSQPHIKCLPGQIWNGTECITALQPAPNDLQVLQDIIDINNLPQTLEEFLAYNQWYLSWNGDRLTSLDLSCQLNRCYLTDIGVEITQLPESLGNLSELTYLGMQGCGLTDLPNSLGTLVLLEELIVYNNDLGGPSGSGTMNDGVFENLTNLRILKMHSNPNLMELPESICNCSSLEELYSYNTGYDSYGDQCYGCVGLWFLPECLHQLTNLRKLHVNGNQFETIDFDICSMTNLEEVYMNSNNLNGDIPECIAGMGWEYGNFQIARNKLWCDYSNPETGCEQGCAPQWYCDDTYPNGATQLGNGQFMGSSGCGSNGYTNQRCDD